MTAFLIVLAVVGYFAVGGCVAAVAALIDPRSDSPELRAFYTLFWPVFVLFGAALGAGALVRAAVGRWL